MYIGKNRVAVSDRQKSPLQNHNHNRGGRRILAVRRVDQASLKKHVITPRKGDLPRKEWNKYQNRLFESDLKNYQEDEEQLPPYQEHHPPHDSRFDIPYQTDRVDLGRRRNLPRRVRKDDFKSLSEAQRIDGQAVRDKLAPHGPAAFQAMQGGSWRRYGWTKARHMEVRVDNVPMTSPMPTHFMRVSTAKSQEEENLLTPIHSAFLRAHCSRLGDLPEFTPMDICTPMDNKGNLMPEAEYASGELPMINLQVNNLETMPHLVAYCYQRNPTALIDQLIGNLAVGFEDYVCKPLTLDQRQMEWNISQKIAANFDPDLIRTHAWFIHDLVENANCLGMEDSAFWWAADTSLRVVMDALIVQSRFTSGVDEDE